MAPGLSETWNYVRMSTVLQEDSPVTQDQHTGDYLVQHGLREHWTRTYYDLGITGAEVDKRPGIMALLTDAERLRPAVIVFYKLDRAFRNSFEQSAALRRLKRLGIKVLKVRDPNIDGPQGDLIDTVLGAVNQFERELTGVRIKDHNQAMAQRGEWPGGPAPFGYAYRKPVKDQRQRKAIILEPGALEPHPTDWAVAKQLWDWALMGHRQAQILEMASSAGYRRRNGGGWTFADLARLYQSRVYAGYVPFNHNTGGKRNTHRANAGEWYHGKHAAMVTLEQWHQVQLSVQQGNRRQRGTRNPRMELAGLIRCGICGGAVASSGAMPDGGFSYTCIAAARKEVDHLIWGRREWNVQLCVEAVLEAAAGRVPHSPPQDDSEGLRRRIEQEIAQLERQMRRLRDLYRLGEYNDDLEAYQADKRRLEIQIAGKQAELRNTTPAAETLAELHGALLNWDILYEAAAGDVLTRQQLWRLFVEQVECDGEQVRVWLRDLGPAVPREWTVPLPPRGTRRPGANQGGGKVVGRSQEGRQRGHMARRGLVPVPVGAVAP